MRTPDGPVCSHCGYWMLPYNDQPDAPLACVDCDLIDPTIIPEYAQAPPPAPSEPRDDL